MRETVQGKVVLFGDLRKPRFGFSADRHRVQYDSDIVDQVPGVNLLGDAIAGLLEGRYMTMAYPLPPTTLATLLLFGGVGCLIPIRMAASAPFERRTHRRVLWVFLSALLAACWFAMVHATGVVTVHASMAGLSLLVPMLGSFWVEFARNRHRILERNRRSIEDLEPAVMAEGTITLPSRQRTSHPPTE